MSAVSGISADAVVRRANRSTKKAAMPTSLDDARSSGGLSVAVRGAAKTSAKLQSDPQLAAVLQQTLDRIAEGYQAALRAWSN